MKLYLLSPKARADLENIWDYTQENWGISQAEKYTNDIRATIESVACGEQHGRSLDYIRAGYRKASIGSHFICYRITGDKTVEIMRILHQRMDIGIRLLE